MNESGIDSDLSRDHGRAPKGERVLGETSDLRFARESFIAGL